MPDSILTSIKKLLGIDETYESFDADILMDINSVFSILNQLGAGPVDGYVVTDNKDKWSDYTEDIKLLGLIKSYVYLKVRLLFDPPQSSSAVDAMNKMAAEYEWRITNSIEEAVPNVGL